MITTRGGLFRKRKKNGTVIAALDAGVLRLQPVEPVELGLAGEVIEIAPERIASIASKPVDAPEHEGEPFCAGLVVKVNTVDSASFELELS